MAVSSQSSRSSRKLYSSIQALQLPSENELNLDMINPLEQIRFKSISHISAEQALELLSSVQANQPKPPSTSVNKSMSMPPSSHLLPTSLKHLSPTPIEHPQPAKRLEIVRKSQLMEESMITNFAKPFKEDELKQEYAVLWYEKLALESSIERLKDQGKKKDELIHQMAIELQQLRMRRGY